MYLCFWLLERGIIFAHTFLLFSVASSFSQVPAGGTPKGFAASLSKRLLNDPATYTYFAPIVYSTCNFTAMWASVLWWRLGDPASTFPALADSGLTWVPALLAHMYVMGGCFPNGANELHYAAHLQVATRG